MNEASVDALRIAELRQHVAQLERMVDARCAALRLQGVAVEARPSDPVLRALVAAMALMHAEIDRLDF
jgi:hypothetical protein